MAYLLVHSMNTSWTSSDETVLQVIVDQQVPYSETTGSNKFTAATSPFNAFAELALNVPLDLSNFEELRFWICGDRQADGSTANPFYLEFSYADTGDAADEGHRWLVPINQAGMWEQRRIGIEKDRRNSIIRFRFQCIGNFSFTCHIGELIAVHEEMLADIEHGISSQLEEQISLPGLTDVPLKQTAHPGDTQIVLPLHQAFHVDNRLRIMYGSSGSELHTVIQIVHDALQQITTLFFDAADKVVGTLEAGTAKVSVLVPITIEAPPLAERLANPAVVVTFRDVREDPERTAYVIQRDSFRQRGKQVVCSERPTANAYLVDYQITVQAPERQQQAFIQTLLLQRLSLEPALYINGVPVPVLILPPPSPTLDERRLGLLAPLYISIGTHMEIASRQELPLVQRANVGLAPPDAPLDQEEIVLEL